MECLGLRKRRKVVNISDGKSFEITTKELVELMSLRGQAAINHLKSHFPNGALDICKLLETSGANGLTGSPEDLEKRKQKFGRNVIPLKPMKHFAQFIFESIKDTTLIILMVAASVSLALGFNLSGTHEHPEDEGEGPVWVEGVAILMAVVVVVLVTSINDWKKERQFRGLQLKIEDTQHRDVMRDGKIIQVPVNDIVVGDICIVKYGDLMAADGIVIESNDLQADESSFTGESELVKKGANKDPMLFSGTYIMEGTGRMVVTAVGVNSQAGSIYTLLAGVTSTSTIDDKTSDKKNELGEPVNDKLKRPKSKEKSVLQAKLTLLAIKIGYIGTIIAVMTVLIMVLRFSIVTFILEDKPWHNKYIQYYLQFFIIGVTVLVVAVPEGLPLAVTLALAYSVRRMMFDNNLVRHLDACETMGNATAICSDKTGTLTTNRMTVMQIHVAGRHFVDNPPSDTDLNSTAVDVITQCISLNSSFTSKIIPSDTHNKLPLQVGNKTECALLSFLTNLNTDYKGIRETNPENSFVKVFTFNSERKYMATVIRHPSKAGTYRVLVKGATEYILEKCKYVLGEKGDTQTYASQAEKLTNVTNSMASDGMRTLCIAFKDIINSGSPGPYETLMPGDINWDDADHIVNNLISVAIVGIEDPVRPEVPKAIKRCQSAGITVRMLTGDSLETARSIAYKTGIIKINDDSLILESSTFNNMIRPKPDAPINQALFDQVWPRLRVLARSSPMDKYNLVKGMIQSNTSQMREVVAVTGDGTNDGPALKIADVGFAMGIAGTDVAKEASDIILLDDNFESLVKAVMWGRNVYDSISKFLQFQLTVNLVAVATSFFGALFITSSPLKAIQMLWVNLIMDTLASLALATERPTEELLNRKPYGRTQPLITNIMMRNILMHALYQFTVIVTIIIWGDYWFDVDNGFSDVEGQKASMHSTIIFNAFVMMTLANQFNCRKLHGQRNVFSDLDKNPIFSGIWITTFLVQILIIEFGGDWFDVVSLDLDLWLWCIFLGGGSLMWGQFVMSIPCSNLPKSMFFQPKYENSHDILKQIVDETENSSGIMWARGMTKLNNLEEAKHAYNSRFSQIYIQ